MEAGAAVVAAGATAAFEAAAVAVDSGSDFFRTGRDDSLSPDFLLLLRLMGLSSLLLRLLVCECALLLPAVSSSSALDGAARLLELFRACAWLGDGGGIELPLLAEAAVREETALRALLEVEAVVTL